MSGIEAVENSLDSIVISMSELEGAAVPARPAPCMACIRSIICAAAVAPGPPCFCMACIWAMAAAICLLCSGVICGIAGMAGAGVTGRLDFHDFEDGHAIHLGNLSLQVGHTSLHALISTTARQRGPGKFRHVLLVEFALFAGAGDVGRQPHIHFHLHLAAHLLHSGLSISMVIMSSLALKPFTVFFWPVSFTSIFAVK